MSETKTTPEENKAIGEGILIAVLEACGFEKYQTDGDRTRWLLENGTLEAVINEKLPTHVFMYDPAAEKANGVLLEISRDSELFDKMIAGYEEGLAAADEYYDPTEGEEHDLDDDDDNFQFMDLDDEEVTELANLLYGNAGLIRDGLEAMCLDPDLYDIDAIEEQLWEQERMTQCAGCTFWTLDDEIDAAWFCKHCQ